MMKLGLAFSGGKDSWACLWLNRDRLDDITVFWVDTGKNYPELLASIEYAKSLCPKFVVVRSDRDAQNREHGIPADVVPVQWTKVGQQFSGHKPVTIQAYLTCCYENISLPLHRAAIEHGITHLIRGQRDDEGHKSPSRSGTVVDGGITYIHPIEGWTGEEVRRFVAKHMCMPEHFSLKHSSMDCYDCTAYRQDSEDRIEFMRERHPGLFAEYQHRRAMLDGVLKQVMN